jgi:hypothetical protein
MHNRMRPFWQGLSTVLCFRKLAPIAHVVLHIFVSGPTALLAHFFSQNFCFLTCGTATKRKWMQSNCFPKTVMEPIERQFCGIINNSSSSPMLLHRDWPEYLLSKIAQACLATIDQFVDKLISEGINIPERQPLIWFFALLPRGDKTSFLRSAV